MNFGMPDIKAEIKAEMKPYLALLTRIADSLDRIEAKLDGE